MLISKFLNNNIDEQIIRFEDDNEIRIPEDEKNFLRKYNGGETPNTSIEEYEVRGFYGVGDVEFSMNKQGVIRTQEDSYLPIALDSFGNDFLISLSNGKIYFRDNESENNIKEIAKSLNEFIAGCYSKGIDKSSLETPEQREKQFKDKGKKIPDALRQAWKEEYEKYHSMKLEKVEL